MDTQTAPRTFDNFVETSPGSVLQTMHLMGAVSNAPTHMQARYLADLLLELSNKPRLDKLSPELAIRAKAIAGGFYSLADRIEAERAPSRREVHHIPRLKPEVLASVPERRTWLDRAWARIVK